MRKEQIYARSIDALKHHLETANINNMTAEGLARSYGVKIEHAASYLKIATERKL